jgi:hypothetical protein
MLIGIDGVDSDLAVLHNRCLANGIDSIVDFNGAGTSYIRGQKHIDLHSMFGKPVVQTTIFKNAYRTLRLDEVSKAVLLEKTSTESLGVGKYKGLTAKTFNLFQLKNKRSMS